MVPVPVPAALVVVESLAVDDSFFMEVIALKRVEMASST
jgi:hypothetical protein